MSGGSFRIFPLYSWLFTRLNLLATGLKKWLWRFLLIIAFSNVWSGSLIQISNEALKKIEVEFGIASKKRVETWLKLIKLNGDLSELEKLRLVNRFINQFEFVEDIYHWGETDYWATPIEFLTTQGGDCEDFSIAKYFTLKALGIAEQRMHITYVKAVQLNQAHMVLTYFATPDAEPLVLDNLVDEIKHASQRSDLMPIYSFNGEGLWLASQRGAGKRVGGANRVGLWRDLLHRMHKNTIVR